MNKLVKKITCGLLCATAMLPAVQVGATSATRTDNCKQLSATIRSDVWIQSRADSDGTGLFQVTAAYSSTNNNYKKPEWVKTAWSFSSVGIGASISYSGIGGSVSGNGSTNSSGGYWINSNGATTAWYKGRVGATGLTLYVGISNTASAFKAGVPCSTTAKV